MLYGERVTLRAMTPADYPRMTAFKNDVEAEVLGGGDPLRPRPLAAVSEFFDGLNKDTSGVNFAIETAGVCIGDCGLYHFDRLSATAEVGIGIGDHAYWGQGYGREALALLLDYAFRLQNLRRVWLETHHTNERAVGCYRSLGFVDEGRLREHVWSDGRYVDSVLMGLLRSEWDARPPATGGARRTPRDSLGREPGPTDQRPETAR